MEEYKRTYFAIFSLIAIFDSSGCIAVSEFRGFAYGALIYGGDDVSGEEWSNRGWRSRKGVNKVESERPITYTKTKNPLAGPYWDRALKANETAVMQRELQSYVNRKAGKR